MNYQEIRKARKAANVTQDELAAFLGVNRATVSKYETGAIEPTLSQLEKIADFLNANIGVFLSKTSKEAFFAGFNQLLHTDRYNNAQTDDAAEEAEEDALSLHQYFNELDEHGQKRAVACVRALAGYEPIIDVNPPHPIECAITAMCKLNEDGQSKAVERVEELTEIPKYQKSIIKEKAPDATNIQD